MPSFASSTFCRSFSQRWVISNVPNGIVVNTLKIVYQKEIATGLIFPTSCTFRSMENDPSLGTAQDLLDDINNGTDMIDSPWDNDCNVADTFVNKTKTLNFFGRTDLQTNLDQNLSWWSAAYRPSVVADTRLGGTWFTQYAPTHYLLIGYTAPSDVIVTPSTNLFNNINVVWTQSFEGSALRGYTVYQSYDNSTFTILGSTHTSTPKSFLDTSESDCATKYYKVAPFYGSGNGTNSTVAVGTTACPAAPSAPTITASNNLANAINLTVTPATNPTSVVGYTIYNSTDNITYDLLTTQRFYNSINNVNGTWYFREHDDTAFTPDFSFSTEGSGANRFKVFSSNSSVGSAYLIKTFDRYDLSGSDIKIRRQSASPFAVTVIVRDGGYDITSMTDFPNNLPIIDKGAGVLGSYTFPANANLDVVSILNASQINYHLSTLPTNTVLIKWVDSNSGLSATWFTRSINITKIANYDLTNPTVTYISGSGLGVTNEHGTVSAGSFTLNNPIHQAFSFLHSPLANCYESFYKVSAFSTQNGTNSTVAQGSDTCPFSATFLNSLVQNIGDMFRLSGDIQFSGGNITSLQLFENGTLTDTNSTIFNATTPTSVHTTSYFFWEKADNQNVRNFTINVNGQTRFYQTQTHQLKQYVTEEYNPRYFDAIIQQQGRVNYTHSRFNDDDSIQLKVNRLNVPSGETWQIECIYQTVSQALDTQDTVVPESPTRSWQGTWDNTTNTGYFNSTKTGVAGGHIYISCFNEDLLFSTVSYTNASLALFGIQAFNVTFGNYLGVPVGVFFVVLAGSMANKRTAPTWIVCLVGIAGIMSTIGFFTLEPIVWGLALVSAMLGLFVNQKIF